MHRKYFFAIVGLAIASLLVVLFSFLKKDSTTVDQDQTPVLTKLGWQAPHPVSPYESFISGVGIVEASSENIVIGIPGNRVVEKVYVHVGSKVKKGDILVQLEDRDLKAELTSRKLEYEIAQAKQQKLEALPRPEDIAMAEAALKNAQIEWAMAKSQYDMVQSLDDPRAISQEMKNTRLYNYQQAETKVAQAKADLEKIKAGSWKPDLQIASLETKQARANVDRTFAEIERNIIRSPIDGTVLQVKIHEGEIPSSDPSRPPSLIVGNTQEMNLRVSINQFDIPFFRKKAPAVAYLQGDARVEFPLEYVRVEPYLVSKQNLTNDISEKVDTRVLQVLYRLKKDDQRVYVGQQMDVFIKADYTP